MGVGGCVGGAGDLGFAPETMEPPSKFIPSQFILCRSYHFWDKKTRTN